MRLKGLQPGQKPEVIGTAEETGKRSTECLALHLPQEPPAQKVEGCQVGQQRLTDSFPVKDLSLRSCSAVTCVHDEACCVHVHTASYLRSSRGTAHRCPGGGQALALSAAPCLRAPP